MGNTRCLFPWAHGQHMGPSKRTPCVSHRFPQPFDSIPRENTQKWAWGNYFFILGFSENFCRVLPARTQKGHRLNGPSEATLGKSDIGTSPECIFECPASSGRVLSSIVSTVTQFPNSAMGTTVNDGAQTGSRGVQGAPPAGGAFFYFYFFIFYFFILGFSEKRIRSNRRFAPSSCVARAPARQVFPDSPVFPGFSLVIRHISPTYE